MKWQASPITRPPPADSTSNDLPAPRRVHGDDEHFGSRTAPSSAFIRTASGAKAAIEANHEHLSGRPIRIAHGRFDGVDLRAGERQRLFDEHVLAGCDRAPCELRMGIVPRRNHDHLDLGRHQRLVRIGRRDFEPVLTPVRAALIPLAVATARSRAPAARNAGINTRPAVIPGADERHGRMGRACRDGGALSVKQRMAAGPAPRPGIRARSPARAASDRSAGHRRHGRRKREPVADQRPHVELRRFHQLQHRLEVSLFRPTHQPKRVVDPRPS